MIKQYSEPPQLVDLLGGVLAIRQVRLVELRDWNCADFTQGSRSHWTSENTTMHLAREYRGAIYIDELDLVRQMHCPPPEK